jgi:hypothetical protein
MSIFKKHKKAIEEVVNFTPVFDYPEVIKEAKIRPTTCIRCQSVYQAKQKHLTFERDFSLVGDHYTPYTICPVCRQINKVKFEITEKGGE